MAGAITTKVAAKDWMFQVSDGTIPTPVWIDISDLTEWSLDPSANEEVANGTHFGSGGEWEGQVLQRGGSMEVKGWRAMDNLGVIDPGQARVDALAKLKGAASVGAFRFRHVSETTWTVWSALFSGAKQGGGTTAFGEWGFKATRSGAATTMPSP